MNTQTTNKNAYEIRLEILSMAEGHLMTSFYEHINTLRDTACREYEEYIREKELAIEEHRECKLSLPTSRITDEMVKSLLPTPSAIAARAKELYTFVEGK